MKQMVFWQAILAIVTLTGAASACRGPSEPTVPVTAAPVTPNVAIVTDSQTYTLTGDFLAFQSKIGMVYTNRYPFAVQVSSCLGGFPNPPMLQRWSGRVWEFALQPTKSCSG